MSRRTSTVLFVIGIVLLVFGVLVYLTGWFFVYGMFIVALGAVLVLITSKPWWLKIAVAATPVLFVAWSFSGSFAPAQTFLIPEGFSGRFVIVGGEPCGAPDNKVDGRYVVDVPRNGVAIIQRERQGGWMNDEFYFVDAAGKRTPIPIGLVDTATLRPSVVFGGAGSFVKTIPEGGLSGEAPGEVQYADYYVLITASDNPFVFDDKLDDRMDSLVQACRGSSH